MRTVPIIKGIGSEGGRSGCVCVYIYIYIYVNGRGFGFGRWRMDVRFFGRGLFIELAGPVSPGFQLYFTDVIFFYAQPKSD